jgi:hypothetical protein
MDFVREESKLEDNKGDLSGDMPFVSASEVAYSDVITIVPNPFPIEPQVQCNASPPLNSPVHEVPLVDPECGLGALLSQANRSSLIVQPLDDMLEQQLALEAHDAASS